MNDRDGIFWDGSKKYVGTGKGTSIMKDMIVYIELTVRAVLEITQRRDNMGCDTWVLYLL